MKKRNNLMFIGILILVVSITVGYAALSQLLTVSGNAAISKATWNVGFDGTPTVDSKSVTKEVPIISTDKKTVSFTTTLSKPSTYYKFTVNVKNSGTIPAKITKVDTLTGADGTNVTTDYIGLSAKWASGPNNGNNIAVDDTVPANTTYSVVITLFTKDISSTSSLPTAAVTLSPSVKLTFGQA